MLSFGGKFQKWRDELFDFDVRDQPNSDRRMRLLIVIIIAATAAFYIAFSDYSPWFDEWASFHFADLPMSELWSDAARLETNPPLFYSLLKLWENIGAKTVVELRMLSIIGGIVALGLAAYIATRWFNPRTGVIIAVLMGLSGQHMYYSQLLRAFIFSVDAILLSVIGLLMIVNQQRQRDEVVGWGLHVAGSSLAIYLHTTMFLWPVVSAAALTGFYGKQLIEGRARLLVRLILANLIILAITSWWLWITYLQLQSGASNIAWIEPISPRKYLRILLRTCTLAFERYDRDKVASTWFAFLTIAAIVPLWRERTVRFLVGLALAAVVVFGVAGAIKPILVPKTVFWMSIFPLFLISAGLGALRSPFARCALVTVSGILLVANLVRWVPNFEREDWQATVRTLAQDRNALLLVQGHGIAKAFEQACQLELRETCPFPVIDVPMRPGPRAKSTPLKESELQAVRQRITPGRTIYSSTYGVDSLRELGTTPAIRNGNPNLPFLRGPFPASSVLPDEVK